MTVNARPGHAAATRSPEDFPLLGSLLKTPDIGERLHTICSLYHVTRDAQMRRKLLKRLEDMTLELAHLLAVDLLENGWRPTERDGQLRSDTPVRPQP
jgi:hypothetical protein